jgi:hypothetical protein
MTAMARNPITISNSPPPSPSISISIDTPPNSPSEQPVSPELAPLSPKQARTPPTSQDLTPMKRQKQFTGLTTRNFRGTETRIHDQESLRSTEPDTLEAALSEPELPEAGIANSYLQYVDLVLADGIAIYQITQTIFVVQGWDSRSLSGTVSVPP